MNGAPFIRAINILNRATPGTGESQTCGEEAATPYDGQASSVKQEAHAFMRG